MFLEPDLVGTITLTSGSTAFTWAGTSLVSRNVREGDTILLPLKGLALKVATVTSATAGTLSDDCPAAAAGVGQVARIEFQPDLARAQGALADALERMSSGPLWSISGLDGTGGDKGLMLSGPGTAATFALTAFARDLLDDANATAVLTTLGSSATGRALFAAANAAAARSTLGGTTVGSNLFTAADLAAALAVLGLGTGNSPTFSAINAIGNAALAALFERTGSATNSVAEFRTSAGGIFIGQGASGRFAVKNAASLNSAPWFEVSSDGPLISNRKMIDGGANANGQYARYADGLQVCWNGNLGSLDTTTALGNIFASASTVSWTFPASFAETPAATAGAAAVTRWATTGSISATSCAVRLLAASSSGITSQLGAIAIGRWF